MTIVIPIVIYVAVNDDKITSFKRCDINVNQGIRALKFFRVLKVLRIIKINNLITTLVIDDSNKSD